MLLVTVQKKNSIITEIRLKTYNEYLNVSDSNPFQVTVLRTGKDFLSELTGSYRCSLCETIISM